MSSNIVHIDGSALPEPGKPIYQVVDGLEKLLELARSGEIKGLAFVATHSDNCTTWNRLGFSTRSTIGTIELMKADLVKVALEQE